eukprot:4595521-Alexandrium_andersonii.AAC.1
MAWRRPALRAALAALEVKSRGLVVALPPARGIARRCRSLRALEHAWCVGAPCGSVCRLRPQLASRGPRSSRAPCSAPGGVCRDAWCGAARSRGPLCSALRWFQGLCRAAPTCAWRCSALP